MEQVSVNIHEARALRTTNLVRGVVERLALDLESGKCTRQDIENWAQVEQLNAQRMVVSTAKLLGVKDINYVAFPGPVGIGKGTNLKAIQEAAIVAKRAHIDLLPNSPSLGNLINSYSGDMATIVTGTGGIFNPSSNPKNEEEAEYTRMFSQMKTIAGFWTRDGILVPDNITNLFFSMMTILRMYQGRSNIQTDLFPRSQGQLDFLSKQRSLLNEAGISSGFNMVEIRGCRPEVVAKMMGNRKLWGEQSVRFGGFIDTFVRENKDQDGFFDGEGGISNIYTFFEDKEVFALFEGQTELCELAREAKLVFGRMKGRSKKGTQSRDDESPMAMLKRLSSFYKNTAPATAQIPGVIIVSGDQDPRQVVLGVVRALVDPREYEELSVITFEKEVMDAASRIVNGR